MIIGAHGATLRYFTFGCEMLCRGSRNLWVELYVKLRRSSGKWVQPGEWLVISGEKLAQRWYGTA